ILRFLYDRLSVSASLPAPGKRDHAKRTHVVAAPHDGDEGGDAIRVETNRTDVCIGFLARQQYVDSACALVHLLDEVRQVTVGIWPDNNVHQFLFFEEF